MKLTDKLDSLIKSHGIKNRKQFSLDIDIPYSTVDGFYKKGYDNMKLSNLIKICDYFNVTLDSMAYDDRDIEYRIGKKGLNKEDQDLITLYHDADEGIKVFVFDALKGHSDRKAEEQKEKETSLKE